MALFRKFFYRKPPDHLLEITERVYVFDCCFSTHVPDEGEYRTYMNRIVAQLHNHFPGGTFMVLNFKYGDGRSLFSDLLAQYGMTVMDYPQQYERCPLLPMEMINHFLRSSDNWLTVEGQHNILLMLCERGGWPVLAFMLAGLLLYRKQYTGEQKTLEMVYKQAPKDLLSVLTPLNPQPSQLRYLQYISRRNSMLDWETSDVPLALDCIILQALPRYDQGQGCRPIVRVYGHEFSSRLSSISTKLVFSSSKATKDIPYYQKEECDLVTIDIHCRVQGDVVLECIHLEDDLVSEKIIFRTMFHTEFVRENVLMLTHSEVDVLWDVKDLISREFKAEVHFSDAASLLPILTTEVVNNDDEDSETEVATPEEFFEAEEIFSSFVDAQGDMVASDDYPIEVSAQVDEDIVDEAQVDKTLVDEGRHDIPLEDEPEQQVFQECTIDETSSIRGSTVDPISNSLHNGEVQPEAYVFSEVATNAETLYTDDGTGIKFEEDGNKQSEKEGSKQKLGGDNNDHKGLSIARMKQPVYRSRSDLDAVFTSKKNKEQDSADAVARWIASNKGSYTNSMHIHYPRSRHNSAPALLALGKDSKYGVKRKPQSAPAYHDTSPSKSQVEVSAQVDEDIVDEAQVDKTLVDEGCHDIPLEDEPEQQVFQECTIDETSSIRGSTVDPISNSLHNGEVQPEAYVFSEVATDTETLYKDDGTGSKFEEDGNKQSEREDSKQKLGGDNNDHKGLSIAHMKQPVYRSRSDLDAVFTSKKNKEQDSPDALARWIPYNKGSYTNSMHIHYPRLRHNSAPALLALGKVSKYGVKRKPQSAPAYHSTSPSKSQVEVSAQVDEDIVDEAQVDKTLVDECRHDIPLEDEPEQQVFQICTIDETSSIRGSTVDPISNSLHNGEVQPEAYVFSEVATDTETLYKDDGTGSKFEEDCNKPSEKEDSKQKLGGDNNDHKGLSIARMKQPVYRSRSDLDAVFTSKKNKEQDSPDAVARWIPYNKGSYTNSMHIHYPRARHNSAPALLALGKDSVYGVKRKPQSAPASHSTSPSKSQVIEPCELSLVEIRTKYTSPSPISRPPLEAPPPSESLSEIHALLPTSIPCEEELSLSLSPPPLPPPAPIALQLPPLPRKLPPTAQPTPTPTVTPAPSPLPPSQPMSTPTLVFPPLPLFQPTTTSTPVHPPPPTSQPTTILTPVHLPPPLPPSQPTTSPPPPPSPPSPYTLVPPPPPPSPATPQFTTTPTDVSPPPTPTPSQSTTPSPVPSPPSQPTTPSPVPSPPSQPTTPSPVPSPPSQPTTPSPSPSPVPSPPSQPTTPSPVPSPPSQPTTPSPVPSSPSQPTTTPTDVPSPSPPSQPMPIPMPPPPPPSHPLPPSQRTPAPTTPPQSPSQPTSIPMPPPLPQSHHMTTTMHTPAPPSQPMPILTPPPMPPPHPLPPSQLAPAPMPPPHSPSQPTSIPMPPPPPPSQPMPIPTPLPHPMHMPPPHPPPPPRSLSQATSIPTPPPPPPPPPFPSIHTTTYSRSLPTPPAQASSPTLQDSTPPSLSLDSSLAINLQGNQNHPPVPVPPISSSMENTSCVITPPPLPPPPPPPPWCTMVLVLSNTSTSGPFPYTFHAAYPSLPPNQGVYYLPQSLPQMTRAPQPTSIPPSIPGFSQPLALFGAPTQPFPSPATGVTLTQSSPPPSVSGTLPPPTSWASPPPPQPPLFPPCASKPSPPSQPSGGAPRPRPPPLPPFGGAPPPPPLPRRGGPHPPHALPGGSPRPPPPPRGAPGPPPPPGPPGGGGPPPPPPGTRRGPPPPPVARGGPPPPPGVGRGIGAFRGQARLAVKKSKLKPLHWSKVSRALKGSLWEELQKQGAPQVAPEFDASEIESLFCATAPGKDKGKDGAKNAASAKPTKIQLIDLKRAYNVEIMLTKVKMSLPDLMTAILSLDDTVLDADQVENLIKFCPKKEEMELLKAYTGDPEMLGKCEQFFLELMKAPRVENKLKIFLFKIQYNSQLSDFKESLVVVNSACEEVRNSDKLKEILQKILVLGNKLNEGTARGAAVGYKLDSLLKLTDTRSTTSKMTLMHFLCKSLAAKNPDLLDFYKDLPNLEASTKIQLKSLADEMKSISKGLEKVKQELDASEHDGPIAENFHRTLTEFIGSAESEVTDVMNTYAVAGKNAEAVAMYFGEDPNRIPLEQVTETLSNFVKLFQTACEENSKQAEADRKKAQKEAEAAENASKV